jgi:hypothetical protein
MDEPRARGGGYYDSKTILFFVASIIGTIGVLLYLFPIWNIVYQDNPYYRYDEEHATAIYYKYDLKNNSNLSCNDYGCASISPIMVDAWGELCSTDGSCNSHDAFHFWYSKDPEVEKVKTLWMKLSTTD